jgi:hypothetical protein
MTENFLLMRKSVQQCTTLSYFLRCNPIRPTSDYRGVFHHIAFDWSGEPGEVSMRLLEVLNDSNSTRSQREDFHAQLIWRYRNKKLFMNLLQTAFGGLK